MQLKSQSIPTNIISGFLGAGKTTAIQYLLSQKPAQERWGILVNEFGDIGIDGALLGSDNQVYLKELVGGCMCCTTSVPFQATLNALLREAKPDRLLIEPTGLGHPKQLLTVLKSDAYKSVLDVRATLTLIDARQIQQSRYQRSDIFNQQLDIADMIVANKADLYQADEINQLCEYVSTQDWFKGQQIVSVENAQIPLEWLDNTCDALIDKNRQSVLLLEQTLARQPAVLLPMETSYQQHTIDGFTAHCWEFGSDYYFNQQRLTAAFSSIEAERVKAICRTTEGGLLFQKASEQLEQSSYATAADSRITLIVAEADNRDWTELFNPCLHDLPIIVPA